MRDRIFEAFLRRQYEEGMALASESDLLELRPQAGNPPWAYVAVFRAKGLVRAGDGVAEGNCFSVGVAFPQDYLRRAETFEVVTWLGPMNVFHPNIAETAPFMCLGRLAPGTRLTEILYRCHEIITYQKVTMAEGDALNKEACAWAREHPERLPVDTRPLKRRVIAFEVTPE